MFFSKSSRACAVLILIGVLAANGALGQDSSQRLLIQKTQDFSITGAGTSPAWTKTEWLKLSQYKVPADTLETKVKALYSDSGLYFLFYCEDKKITSTMKADFMDLWKEDVVEVFLQPDSSMPSYFEYELSPRNFELPILIANVNGSLRRWMPFHYEPDRKTKHKTKINGKGAGPDGEISSWTAEFFIPYALLSPLKSTTPVKGEQWKGNFYRVDYDHREYASWLWQRTRANFHDMERFGILEFQ